MTAKNSSYFDTLEAQYGRLSFGEMLKSWRDAEKLSQVTHPSLSLSFHYTFSSSGEIAFKINS
jgi:hypothetical protein